MQPPREKAREWLNKAKTWRESKAAEPAGGSGSPSLSWQEKLDFDAVVAEAEKLLGVGQGSKSG